MSNSVPENNSSAGAASDPWLGVHVLSKFVFCPRAGLIAFESRGDDTGQELDGTPRLDYLPDFEQQLIEEALQKTWNNIWRFFTITSPVALAIAGVGYLVDWRLAAILACAAVFFVRWLVGQFRHIVILGRRLTAAQRATAQEPDPASSETQVVNWWELLKAGFTPVQYEEPHEDPSMRLRGRPWRVLEKGSLRIPVFRKRLGKAEIHEQQLVRMAAYCHLVETAEAAQSPYGVVIFGDGYEGVTVPNTAENQEKFAQGVRAARRLLEAVENENLLPGSPQQSAVCRGCHLGQPRAHWPGKSDTILSCETLPAFRTRGNNNKIYHSTCGDRFGWVPPHDVAKELELL